MTKPAFDFAKSLSAVPPWEVIPEPAVTPWESEPAVEMPQDPPAEPQAETISPELPDPDQDPQPVENPELAVQRTRFELGRASAAFTETKQARDDFSRPFQERELELQANINLEQAHLNSLREQLPDYLDNETELSRLQDRMDAHRLKISRLTEQLAIQRQWPSRETEALENLRKQHEQAYFDLGASHRGYVFALRTLVLKAKDDYLSSLRTLFGAMSEAYAVDKTAFTFEPTEFEITGDGIRTSVGIMPRRPAF